MKKRLLIMVPMGIGAIVVVTVVGGTVVQLLWNWLLPPLFGWPRVTFWQAFGLLVLCRILFGGRGGLGSDRSRPHTNSEHGARFRQRVRERFGLGPPASQVDEP